MKKTKRVLSFLLAICLIAGLMPVVASADSEPGTATVAFAGVDYTVTQGEGSLYLKNSAAGAVSTGTQSDHTIEFVYQANGVPTIYLRDAYIKSGVYGIESKANSADRAVIIVEKIEVPTTKAGVEDVDTLLGSPIKWSHGDLEIRGYAGDQAPTNLQDMARLQVNSVYHAFYITDQSVAFTALNLKAEALENDKRVFDNKVTLISFNGGKAELSSHGIGYYANASESMRGIEINGGADVTFHSANHNTFYIDNSPNVRIVINDGSLKVRTDRAGYPSVRLAPIPTDTSSFFIVEKGNFELNGASAFTIDMSQYQNTAGENNYYATYIYQGEPGEDLTRTVFYPSWYTQLKIVPAYKVNVNGGTADKADKVRVGDTVTLTPDPAEAGKVFDGWTSEQVTITDNKFTMPAGNVNITATYEDEEIDPAPSCLTFTLNDDGESYSVTDCDTSASGELVIPATYEGKPVTGIGACAFLYCTGLTSIAIPNSVTYIGDEAFESCGNLSKVIYCGTAGEWISNVFVTGYNYGLLETPRQYHNYQNGICTICKDCLWEYTIANGKATITGYTGSETDLTVPSIIGDLPVGCIGEEELVDLSGSCINIPNNVTSITVPSSVVVGHHAFYGCTNLTSVTVGNTGFSSFSGCTGLTNVTFLDGTTFIGVNSFHGCTGLTSVTIPDSVTGIGLGAFAWCDNLTAVILGKGVTEIGQDAFYDCSNLRVVFYRGTEAQKSNIDFEYSYHTDALINATWHYEVVDTVFANQDCYYCAECDTCFLPNGDAALATVTFYDWDGTELSSQSLRYNETVTVPTTPTRQHAQPNVYKYVFSGWGTEVSAVCKGNATYTATFNEEYVDYTVTFENWDGTVLSTKTYHWGDVVTAPADPTRMADNTYTYTFAGWDKNVVNCTGDAIYTATYTPTYIEYTVTFKNWDGTTLSTKTYHWGDTVTAPANPTRATDTYYTYTFGGWDRQIDTVCTANATYIAQYSKVSHSKASISASADTLNRGDTFSVTAKLDNNIPVNLVTFILDFDSDVFELLGGNCLVDGTAVFQIIPEDKAGTLLLTNAAVISGDVIEFRLKVKDGAAFDTSSISVQTFIGNGKGNEIDSAGAELSVVCAHEYAPWENLDSTYKIQICTICGHEEIGYIDYIVYFIRDDGTVIAEQTYHYGQQIVPPANATKDADTYYAYTFAGWDREIAAACTANATYIAQYSKVSHSKASISASVDTLNRGDTFTVTAKLDNNIPVNLVTFILDFDSDVFELLGGNCLVDGTAVFQIIPEDKAGTLLLTNAAVISGDVIEFRLKVKDGAAFDTSGISARAFIGTDSGNEIDTAGTELAVVCKHEYAPWEKLNNTYNIRACTICGHEEFEYIDYTVVFKNWNDEIISTKTYHYGDEIEIPANPTKTADETYTYTFAGWDSEVVACAGDATYKATYTAEYIDYTVVFKDWNDEIISTKTYHYGDTIEIPANPTKAADETYTYTFAGWDNEVVACAGDATYTATYDKEYINYTVVFKNWDDTVISTQTYHYGDEIEIPANPTKVADNAYTYTFAGWDSEVSANCAGNATYKATYTAVCLYEYLVEDGEVIITDYIGSETNVTIPSTIEGLPVTTIGYGAFYNCTGLTSVVIPNSVTTIDYDAFSNCTGLTSITIPDSVTYINAEEAPFSGCTNLTGIWVSENNPAYSSDSRGVLFNKGKTVLMAAPYKISGSYTIPSSVIGFCRGAFAGRTGLTNIVIPDGVTSFNYYLFEGCTGLTSITIPGSVSYISVDAFANCTGLREVVILDGVTEISVTAFSGCTNLTSITVPDSLATIGLGAFTNCVGLTSINLPNSVTTIREGAFDGCTNLTTVIYCGTQEQWNAISIEDAMNEPLIEATLQLHNIENGVCTICGHKVPYTVTFKNWDGTVISTNTYHWGDTVIAPVNPTKQHAQANVYRYVFAGWDNEVVDCTGDATYIATYTEEYIDYTVVFKNWDGTVLSTETYHYGDAVTAPANPTKTADETYTYTFAGWDSEVSANCAGNATYKATYTEEYINYTVVFKNWNGNVLSSQTYHWGDVVTVPAEPTKAADNVGTYTFAGWDKAVATSCDGNVTYTATYTTTYINYTVVFKNWDGAVLSTKTYHWGDTVTVPANPTRPTDDTYIYTFAGWDSEVSANCAGNATYKATYTEKYIDYTVVFKNWDGTVLSTNTYHWGDAITTPANPSKAADNVGSYAFAGWDNDVVENCAGNATYTATYTTTYINYTVVFKNWDGTVLSTKTYHWGDNVTKPANPTRPTDDTYIYTFTGWDKTVASSCNGNVVYTAVYSSKTRVPSTITSSTYQVSGGTISNISIGTTVSALVGKLNEGQYVKVYNGNTEVSGSAAIGTGMVVKIMDGTTVKASVTVVVTGDTNGDGKTTVTDMLAIKSHLLKKSTLSGASGQAADTSGDNALSITDFIQMKAHILGKSTITPRSASAVALTSTTSETTPATTQPAATVVMLNNITTDAIVPTRKDYVVNL